MLSRRHDLLLWGIRVMSGPFASCVCRELPGESSNLETPGAVGCRVLEGPSAGEY